MIRTRVGYCGGETPDPTYRKVCASHADKGTLAANGYAAYAETVQLEFDSAKISYADVLDAFFRAHDAERRGAARPRARVDRGGDGGNARRARVPLQIE